MKVQYVLYKTKKRLFAGWKIIIFLAFINKINLIAYWYVVMLKISNVVQNISFNDRSFGSSGGERCYCPLIKLYIISNKNQYYHIFVIIVYVNTTCNYDLKHTSNHLCCTYNMIN